MAHCGLLLSFNCSCLEGGSEGIFTNTENDQITKTVFDVEPKWGKSWGCAMLLNRTGYCVPDFYVCFKLHVFYSLSMQLMLVWSDRVPSSFREQKCSQHNNSFLMPAAETVRKQESDWKFGRSPFVAATTNNLESKVAEHTRNKKRFSVTGVKLRHEYGEKALTIMI